MILILAEQLELNVNAVCEILTHRKARWFRWNGEDIPGVTKFTFECRSKAHIAGGLTVGGGNIQFQDIRAVWNRRRGSFGEVDGLAPGRSEFIKRECLHARSGHFELLRHAAWMNDPNADQRAHNKLLQLRWATALGMNIPSTIVTQDPSAAHEFYLEHGQRVICKSISPSAEIQGDNERSPRIIYANILNKNMEKSDFETVKIAPTLFQEYVEKDYEIRVSVVGRSIFSAVIESQNSSKTQIDWRRYDRRNTPYYPYRIPSELESKILELMQVLGLEFGAIDLIRSPNGEYTFLEVNPGGQWGWVESLTGLPITEAIAEWLIHRGGAA